MTTLLLTISAGSLVAFLVVAWWVSERWRAHRSSDSASGYIDCSSASPTECVDANDDGGCDSGGGDGASGDGGGGGD